MRLNLFIHLLNSDKKIKPSGASGLSTYDVAEKIAAQDESLEDQGKPVEVKLTGKKLSEAQQLVQLVKQRNEKRAEESSSSDFEKLEIPPSLTAKLKAPTMDFESFMKQLTANPELLQNAHGEIDRQQALALLG